ncbi:unnamed protein product, partial [Iphiclides podalirius]
MYLTLAVSFVAVSSKSTYMESMTVSIFRLLDAKERKGALSIAVKAKISEHSSSVVGPGICRITAGSQPLLLNLTLFNAIRSRRAVGAAHVSGADGEQMRSHSNPLSTRRASSF